MSATTATTTPAPPETKTDLVNTYGRIAVSIIVVFTFVPVMLLAISRSIPESSTTTSMVQLLGTLTTIVVGYWVGSSSGSTAKDAKAAPTPVPGTTITTPATVTTTTTP